MPFHEPDLDGALTAIAVEPAGRRFLRRLPLVLSGAPLLPAGGGDKMTTTTDLRHELLELAVERDALRAQLEGDLPAATRWLQRKVWRQARELDRLNRRVTRQRFVLRTLDGLGRSLTAEEFRAARDALSDERLRERITE